ncbi:alkylhydroperoxidase [Actinophytocola xinjiangensis]|uniref:Alkylhydroperoxidase n=1 Tax=Actinophytocola xinjiangensis TaxID=485602 RepID=A0A7Z0WS35_9PSEU|nr:carboxymuconolactone decarboxylase family protein [Actinophytocola xinjiangensis]OLF12902.1 alkylhydroperoxidase [Actinophytocola xinjiangensis]
MFVDHTIDSAPPAARRAMTAVAERLGYLPAAVGRLAESPAALEGFLRMSGMFEATSLAPLERETVIMTVSVRNQCAVCVAMHTATLVRLEADDGLVAGLRTGAALAAPRLEALRRFTVDVLDTAGGVSDEQLNAFLGNGFSREQALEVVLGIGAYTLSTMANRLTGAPVDEALTPGA